MPTSPIRLKPSLVNAAEREGMVQKRSTPKQIEYWAEFGRVAEQIIDFSDVLAICQGLKRLRLETVASQAVDSEDVFSDIEIRTQQGILSDEVAVSPVYFEAHRENPELIDRVDLNSGCRQAGRFRNGAFEFHS